MNPQFSWPCTFVGGFGVRLTTLRFGSLSALGFVVSYKPVPVCAMFGETTKAAPSPFPNVRATHGDGEVEKKLGSPVTSLKTRN